MTCVNAYDTITQADGTPLSNHYDYTDAFHTVTSYCRTPDGTWVAWINQIDGGNTDGSTGDADKNAWPSEIASMTPIGVGFFPDDGSGPVVYELGIDPCFNWDAGGVYAGRDPCSWWPLLGDKYSDSFQCILTAWFSGVLDVQVRTDGTNVWVVALAREAVKYPFLYNSPTELDACGHAHPTFESDWASGDDDPFVHDTDSGHRFWLYRSYSFGGDQPFGAYDDPGPFSSFRWQPARVTVWAGDIGGFTRLDTVEAKFNNYDAGLIGGIEAAASPAEPGVLHLLWAEAGDFGVQTVEPKRGQRINYTRWDTSEKTLDTDLKYKSEDGSGDISDANWVWTSEYILRNDHGSPVAIVWPWIADGGPQSPSTQPEFWDLSAGTADVLQTLSADLVPTASELGLGTVAQAGLLPNFGDSTTPSFSPRRSQFASSIYTDPKLGNTDVYLICSTYSEAGFQEGSAKAFYRVPCDGSDGFSFLDGIREVMYSIIPADTFSPSGGNIAFISDFVSDPDDVWVPAASNDSTGGAVLQLDRQCKRGWSVLLAFPVPDASTGYESGAWPFPPFSVGITSPPAIVNDGTDDWIYGGGYGPTLTALSTDPTNIAALKAKICRCCQPCNRTGMHVWEII